MAPSVMTNTAPSVASPLSPRPKTNFRRVSGASGYMDTDGKSHMGMSQYLNSRRSSSRRLPTQEATRISSVVSSLKRRHAEELGVTASPGLPNTTHMNLLDWIRTQRMNLLPPEGSDYDKVLAWAQLLIERLHSFDMGIAEFAGDSYLAAHLAYGYCFMLLQLGSENASALMTTFGFFHSTSMALANLLERTELFSVTHEVREQLIAALADLVTLIASVSTHFHNALRGLMTASVSIDIHRTFPRQIETFRQRCESIAESMWRHQLLRDNLDEDKVSEIKSIRSWLAPHDPVLGNVAEKSFYLAHDRAELTCLWVSPSLARFLKGSGKSLCITGKPGSGKTVLASVINDQLQHPIGGTSYTTLFIPINGRVPAEATPRATVKAILRQLFEKRIGNVQLFQILSDAYERSWTATNDNDYDNILWNALQRALSAPLQNANELVIVVDGVDEASCGETALLQRLIAATAKAPRVKLITLAAENPPHTAGQTHIRVTEELVFDDIGTVVRDAFQPCAVFRALSEMEQEAIVNRITEAAHGSFLWAQLATKRVRHEQSADALGKAVETLTKANAGIIDLVLHFLQKPDVTAEAKFMLLWLATADRPLQVKELSTLVSINVDKQKVSNEYTDPLQKLQPLNSLVFLQDGCMYVRHGLIREAVLEAITKGKLLPNVTNSHADLSTRLLVYLTAVVTEQREASLTPLDQHDTTVLLNKHPLLDFAVRYWVLHLRRTSAFMKQGETQVAKDIAKFFPSSTAVAQLESTIWESIPTPELLSYHSISTNVRRQIFTINNVATLQSTIFLAQLYRRLNFITEAVPLFHQVATIGRHLITTRIIVMQMASTFLEMTTEKVTSSKTDIMANREEILLLLVDCYKAQYGHSSEKVITIMKQLVEHYEVTKEERKAQEALVVIQSLSTSKQEVSHSTSEKLHVHLVNNGANGFTERGNTLGLDIEERDSVINAFLDIESKLQLAAKYSAEGYLELAERIYVEVWQHVAHESRTHHSAIWEERKMKSILLYSKFLQSQRREHECSSLLSSFWQDTERTSVTESSVSYFLEIAKTMKTVGLSTMALAIFKQCSEYYQSTSRTESTAYKEVQESIQVTTSEVMQTTTSSTSIASETTLEEIIFEASSSITTFNQASFTTTDKLVGLYISQHRWKDAIHVIKRVLHGVWPSLFAPSLQDVTLPEESAESCVELAERLSNCYYSRRRSAKGQDIQLRVYRALRSGRDVEDKLRQRVVTALIRSLERGTETDLIINVYQELLKDYTDHYGADNTVVIKTLRTLALLTRPRPIFIDYYEQIIRTLNKGPQTCHPEAFEPLVIVATELWVQGRYQDALPHYRTVFATFSQQPKLNSKLEEQTFVRELFTRYTHCLRTVRTDYEILRRITLDYHSRCKAAFGATASITVQATLTLAKLSQESKQYELDAIALYEGLLNTKSEGLDLEEISATLDSIYEDQAAVVSSATMHESISTAQMERTVKVLKKRISSVRETYGWAHEESLSQMKEMVSFHAKRKEIEAINQELKEATKQILLSETSSAKLSAAAATIAASYITAGQTQKVTALREEVYRQVMLRDTSNSKEVQFDLTTKARQSLIFLAQLEGTLAHQSSGISDILASLTTEYVYFEEFRKDMKSKTSTVLSVTVSAARLYRFLITSNHQAAAASVFSDFMSYFVSTEGKRTKLTETSQVEILVRTLLDHFSTYESQSLVRSVGIMSNSHVTELLRARKYDLASDLSLASFRYISAHDEYRTPGILKLILSLGMTISGRGLSGVDKVTYNKLIAISSIIIADAFRVIKELKIDMAQVDLTHLNSMIRLLGEQQNYQALAWLLAMLWNSRQAQHTWQPYVSFSLGRRFILARFLTKEYTAALRLAEDIVYNYRQVYGARHSNTLEMSILLSQLYTSIAQKYQATKDGQDLAQRYYKKGAALHENILRAFLEYAVDESEGSVDGSLNGSVNGDSSVFDLQYSQTTAPKGEQIRTHLKLLKLAVERLGGWPKDYSEYERLNSDLFREFPEELESVQGVEMWNLKAFGSGKAESREDELNLENEEWQLFDEPVVGELQIEEEL
ncbi:hypothetical protein BBP40_009907 [Aspergillus hancockii]|nr:hypothetical protein BBP40_009907 [Aspergillus hancockii]